MKSRRPFLPSILTVMTVLGCGGSGSGDAPPASTPPAPAVDVRRATYPLDPSFADVGVFVGRSPLANTGRPNLDVRDVMAADDGGVWAVGTLGPIISSGALFRLTPQGRAAPHCGAAGLKVFDKVAGREKPVFNRLARGPNGATFIGGAAGFVGFAAKLNAATCDWDPNFGAGGAVLMPDTDAFGDTAAFAVVDRSDRVVIVANRGGWTFLARFDPSGQIDRSFGTQGVVRFGASSGFLTQSVVFDSQGRIYLGGNVPKTLAFAAAVARLSASGAVDVSFGVAGWARYEMVSLGTARITALTVLADDSIVALGNTATDATLDSIVSNDSFALRLRSDGALDPSFGQNGWLRWDGGFSSSDMLAKAIVRADGRIAACGHTLIDLLSGQRASVVHLTPSGSLVPSAPGKGRAMLDSLPNSDCFALAEDGSGRLLLGGSLTTTQSFVVRTAN